MGKDTYLIKVNDRVNEIPFAQGIITFSTCFVIMDLMSIPDTKISQIFPLTLSAYFQVSVSMQFSNIVGRNSTFTMKSIYILAY